MQPIKFLCLAGTALVLSAAVQAQNLQYHITGKLKNISPMPARMYLSETLPAGILEKKIDSADVKNGEYRFDGQLTDDEPIGINISTQLKGANPLNRISVILDKGGLLITSDKIVSNFTVTGSGALANSQFDEIKSVIKATSDSVRDIQASEAYKTDKELQKQVQLKSLRTVSTLIFNMYTYIKAHPDNRISPYGTFFLLELPFLSQPGKDTLVSILPAKAKADKLGQAILQTNARNLAVADSIHKVLAAKSEQSMSKIPVGSKELDFTQNDIKGNPVKLSSFKGKYVLVDFWASWCMPCRAENPNVVKNYRQYRDKGFTVLGVSLDAASSKTAWLQAIEKDGLNWTQVSDLAGWGNSAAKLYGVGSIPQNFLIDPNGIIVGKNLRGDELTKTLAAIFNK